MTLSAQRLLLVAMKWSGSSSQGVSFNYTWKKN